MTTPHSGPTTTNTGGFVVTQSGDRIVAVWRPPLLERMGTLIFIIATWFIFSGRFLLASKGSILTPGTTQVDWVLVIAIIGGGSALGAPATLILMPNVLRWVRAEIGDEELTVSVRNWRRSRSTWKQEDLIDVELFGQGNGNLLIVGRKSSLAARNVPYSGLSWLRATIRQRYGLSDRPDPAWLEPGRGEIPASEYSRPSSHHVPMWNEQGLIFDLPPIATSQMRKDGFEGLIGSFVRLVIAVSLVAGCFWVIIHFLPNPGAFAFIQIIILAPTWLMLGLLGFPIFLQALAGFVRKETIVLGEESLTSTVRHGLFRICRTRRLDSLRRLTVRSVSTGEDSTLGQNGETLARLDAEFEGQPCLCLAKEHPRAELVSLAKSIAYEAHRRQIAVTLLDHPHRAATAFEIKSWDSSTTLTILETGQTARVQFAPTDQSISILVGYAGVFLAIFVTIGSCGAIWLWHNPTFHDALMVAICGVGATLFLFLLESPGLLGRPRPGTLVLNADGLNCSPTRWFSKVQSWKIDDIDGFSIKEYKNDKHQVVSWSVELLRRSGSTETLLGSHSQEQVRQAVEVLSETLARYSHREVAKTPEGTKLDWAAFASIAPPPPEPWKAHSTPAGDGINLSAATARELVSALITLFAAILLLPLSAAVIKETIDSTHPFVFKILIIAPIVFIGLTMFLYGFLSLVASVTSQMDFLNLSGAMVLFPDLGDKRIGVAWEDLESIEMRKRAKRSLVYRVTRLGVVLFRWDYPGEIWAHRRDGSELKLCSGDKLELLEWMKDVIEAAAEWRRSQMSERDAAPNESAPRL